MTPIQRRFLRRAAIGASLCLAAAPAVARDRHRPPAPPRAAIAACAGMAVNDACELTIGGRTEAGTCTAVGDALACRPEEMPPHGPPPEAVEACAGQAEGASCAVTLSGDTLDGTCAKEPGGEVACRPDRMPPPPGAQ